MRATYVYATSKRGGATVIFEHPTTTFLNIYEVSKERYATLAKIVNDLACTGKMEVRPWVITDRVGWIAREK